MERRDSNTEIIIQKNAIDSMDVYGDDKKIVEIIGEGSGMGFRLKNLNLPKDWDGQIDFISEFTAERFKNMNQPICEKWGFSLEKIVFDPNNILVEAVIRKQSDNSIAKIFLDDFWSSAEKGRYKTEGLDKIMPAMVFQEVMSKYLNLGLGADFNYGYIGGCPSAGFGPVDMIIPKHIFESDQKLVNDYYQESFCCSAANIAGRFGLNIQDITFNKRGVLSNVAVDGNATSYGLYDGGNATGEYHEHNVDNSYQAAALHTIVASYINFLLEKDYRDAKD